MASSRSELRRNSPRQLPGGLGLSVWRFVLGSALLPAPLLSACGSSPPPDTITLPPPVARPAAKTTAAAAEPQPTAGFTPLPTPQQVIAALPTGRIDPFAPLPQATAAGTNAPAGDLRFTGVIRSRGQAQALVQLGDQSGAVCVGRRGVCSGSGLPALLPADWSVTSIDVASGRLVLNQGGQRRVLSL
jgi:hypothetical protein